MKTAKQILSDCFLGIIDFNETAALAAMERYAKQESAELLEALNELRIAVGNITEWNRFLDEPYKKAVKAIKKATQ